MSWSILVVEDDRDVCDGLVQVLSARGYRVTAVGDGAEALTWLERNGRPAVIVLDLMLPGVDGLTVCRRLRQAGKKTPILIISARDMVEDRVRGLDAGADDYLVKPFALVELAARLRALNRRHRSTEGPVLKVGDLELDPAARAAP